MKRLTKRLSSNNQDNKDNKGNKGNPMERPMVLLLLVVLLVLLALSDFFRELMLPVRRQQLLSLTFMEHGLPAPFLSLSPL